MTIKVLSRLQHMAMQGNAMLEGGDNFCLLDDLTTCLGGGVVQP